MPVLIPSAVQSTRCFARELGKRNQRSLFMYLDFTNRNTSSSTGISDDSIADASILTIAMDGIWSLRNQHGILHVSLSATRIRIHLDIARGIGMSTYVVTNIIQPAREPYAAGHRLQTRFLFLGHPSRFQWTDLRVERTSSLFSSSYL
ncbi:unnamed protein product [Cyclocybe aegerita]|uniref:Uncharacterized protein n=1 Tax=Cyclocybe aegerita TaxID=1973307 RepID=A0A8S0W4M7_CYCAE|nr:unnamed protein product [Cyclocybe aegerita]